jgi:hypothetical protein
MLVTPKKGTACLTFTLGSSSTVMACSQGPQSIVENQGDPPVTAQLPKTEMAIEACSPAISLEG